MVKRLAIIMYIHRKIEDSVLTAIKHVPVVALIGPRQSGKSTLAKNILSKLGSNIYLDLELPSDLRKLEDPEWFLTTQKGKLICLDEIQRKPELFPVIRSLVDAWGTNTSFLILGSASRDLLRQSSETLAGRINYKTLTPFLWSEVMNHNSIEKYFTAGGFPRSFLAADGNISFEWRENFIATFLERDLLQWKGFTPATMQRLWQMLAHVNGQTVDYTKLSNSLDVSSVTVKTYIDLLESTFMVNVIPSYISNLGKRMVKSPKVYLADSGITATLLGLKSFEELSGHPSFGSLWEQIVLSNLKGTFPSASFCFYRTSQGSELDFVMKLQNHTFAIECKASFSPTLSKGNYFAMEDIAPDHTFIASPINKGWPMQPKLDVVSLPELEAKIKELIS